jgi:hypothetical protein
VSCGATLADASRGGSADGVSFRADNRESGSVSVWQADHELSGLVPLEKSSGNRRRLGHITKQGNSLLRFLLAERRK